MTSSKKYSTNHPVPDPEFWKKKSVLITGHTGFKGSWLSLWLKSLGAKVVGLALSPATEPNLYDAAGIQYGMRDIRVDIRDAEALLSAIQTYRPEIVFHLAAQPLVRRSYKEPVETYATNVMGTVHLLEAIRTVGATRSCVVVTSDKCYENREWLWGYRENDQMGGYDPYSSSKGCAELISAAYRKSYFNPAHYDTHGVALATVRSGNVIGGGDWSKDRLVTDTVRAFSRSKEMVIRNPAAVRPWMHVFDPLRGYLVLAEKLMLEGGTYAEGWNFGPGFDDCWTTGKCVEKMAELWGGGKYRVATSAGGLHEAGMLRLDWSKAATMLGWKPIWQVERALAETIDWYKSYYSGATMEEWSRTQLSIYIKELTFQ